MNSSHLDSDTLMLLAYDELEAPKRLVAERHIDSCMECRQAFHSIGEVCRAYGELPLETPPRGLLQQIVREQSKFSASARWEWWLGWHFFVRSPGWAAASLCGFFLVFAIGWLRLASPIATSPSNGDLSWDGPAGDSLAAVSARIVLVDGNSHSLARSSDWGIIAVRTTEYEISDLDKRIQNLAASIEQEPTQYL